MVERTNGWGKVEAGIQVVSESRKRKKTGVAEKRHPFLGTPEVLKVPHRTGEEESDSRKGGGEYKRGDPLPRREGLPVKRRGCNGLEKTVADGGG